MSIYEYLLRGTYTLKHRKGGGWFIPIPKRDVATLRADDEYRLEIVVVKTQRPPTDSMPEPTPENRDI